MEAALNDRKGTPRLLSSARWSIRSSRTAVSRNVFTEYTSCRCDVKRIRLRIRLNGRRSNGAVFRSPNRLRLVPESRRRQGDRSVELMQVAAELCYVFGQRTHGVC